jgi:hypothetical protein
MMFPTGDPFAYPNQGNRTGESYDTVLKDIGTNSSFEYSTQRLNANGFMPPSSTFMLGGADGVDQGLGQDSDVQLLGPMPMYLMQGGGPLQGQQQINNGYNPNGMSSPTEAMVGPPLTLNLQSNGQRSNDSNKVFSNSNMNLDQLLGGEEWANLPAGRLAGPSSSTNAFVSQSTESKGGPFTRKGVPGATVVSAPDDTTGLGFNDLTPSMLGWGLEGY